VAAVVPHFGIESALCIGRQRAGLPVRTLGQPVGFYAHARDRCCGQRQCAGVIRARDQHPLRRDLADEFPECFAECCRRRVAINVIPFNIGDNADLQFQAQEHPVVLVGFDDERALART